MPKLQKPPSGGLEQTAGTEDDDNHSSAYPSTPVRHRTRPSPLAVVPSSEDGEVSKASSAKGGGGYAVGYKKPPRHSQFKKGESGNAKGRPKGALSLRTIVTKAMNTRTSVKINGVARMMSHLEVAVNQQLKKAIAGDVKAFQLLASLLPAEESGQSDRAGSIQSAVSANVDVSASERAMLAHQHAELLRAQGVSEEAITTILVNMGLSMKSEGH